MRGVVHLRYLQDFQKRAVPRTAQFMSLEFVGVAWAGERDWELPDNLEKSL